MKQLAIVLLSITIAGSSLFAQAKPGGIARQIAMGGSQAGSNLILNPFIINDPAYMLLNPAYQAMYKDYAWINIGGGTPYGTSVTFGTPASLLDEGYGHQFSGINFALNDQWTVGAVLSYDPSAAGAVSAMIAGGSFGGFTLPSIVRGRGAQSIPGIANVWEALVSYDGGSFDAGFGFMYGSSTAETKTTPPAPAPSTEAEASSRMFGFRGGINFDLGSGSAFDASVAVRLDNATDNVKSSTGTAGEYSASGTELVFGARGKFRVSNKVNFVPYGSFMMVSAEPKEDTAPTGATGTTHTIDLSANVILIGLGGEFRTSSIYLAGGIGWQYVTSEIKTKLAGSGADTTANVSYMGLPTINIGGEWWFTDWLAGRAGYYRSMGRVKTEVKTAVSGTSETTNSAPNSFILVGGLNPGNTDQIVTLGIGLKFGGFSLDATVSEQALRRGLGLIGSSDNINTFGYLTGSYNFE
jgi:hypothetical protein